jgi:hypothetical protein
MAVLSPGHQLIKPEGAVTQDSVSLSTIVTVAVDGELSVAPEGLLSVTVKILSPLRNVSSMIGIVIFLFVSPTPKVRTPEVAV